MKIYKANVIESIGFYIIKMHKQGFKIATN